MCAGRPDQNAGSRRLHGLVARAGREWRRRPLARQSSLMCNRHTPETLAEQDRERPATDQPSLKSRSLWCRARAHERLPTVDRPPGSSRGRSVRAHSAAVPAAATRPGEPRLRRRRPDRESPRSRRQDRCQAERQQRLELTAGEERRFVQRRPRLVRLAPNKSRTADRSGSRSPVDDCERCAGTPDRGLHQDRQNPEVTTLTCLSAARCENAIVRVL